MIAPLMLACSSGTGPEEEGCDDCGSGERQVAEASINPKSATIARGGTMNATVTYSASSNLRITGYNIQRQPTGISVTQTSTSGSGNNVVRSYAITADATVPVGTHIVRFWISVDNATSTVETTRAELSLNVTQ